MKRLVFLLALLGASFAQPVEAFLQQVYPANLQYLNRAFQVESALDNLALIKADPYAIPYHLGQAETQLEIARADEALTRAEIQARGFELYVAVLLAQHQVNTLEKRLELLRLSLEEAEAQENELLIAEVKRDMERYENDLQRVRERDLEVALHSFSDYGDVTVELLKPPPALLLESLSITTHPRWIEAAKAVERAALDHQLAQGPGTSANQLKSQQHTLEAKRANFESLDQAFTSNLELSKNRYAAAQAGSLQAANLVEEAQIEFERTNERYLAGEASELELRQVESGYLEVQGAHQFALVELWKSYFEILRSVGGYQNVSRPPEPPSNTVALPTHR